MAFVVEDERTLELPIVDIPPNVDVLDSDASSSATMEAALLSIVLSRSSDKPNADLAANKFLFFDDDEDDIL